MTKKFFSNRIKTKGIWGHEEGREHGKQKYM
jgi:hypothetical protein